jgi:hypothetical protein
MPHNHMETSMRAYLLGCTVALGLAVSIQTASARPSLPNGAALAPPPATMLAAHHHCGQGQRWVPAGYAKHGKYRVGHCASS